MASHCLNVEYSAWTGVAGPLLAPLHDLSLRLELDDQVIGVWNIDGVDVKFLEVLISSERLEFCANAVQQCLRCGHVPTLLLREKRCAGESHTFYSPVKAT